MAQTKASQIPGSSRTEYKLAEARFFLAHVEEKWRQVPDVDFYLSAFVAAARSVTWIMKAEFGKVPEWQAWYDGQKPDTEVLDLLEKMNDVRVRSMKAVPVKTTAAARVTIPKEELTPELIEFLESGAQGEVRLHPVDSSNTVFFLKRGEQVLARVHLKATEHRLPEFGKHDSKDVCRAYFTELERLVDKCIEKFKVQVPS